MERKWKLLRGHHWKAFRKDETHLITEDEEKPIPVPVLSPFSTPLSKEYVSSGRDTLAPGSPSGCH